MKAFRLSGIGAAEQCPAKVKREQGLPEQASDIATAGTLIHSAMAGDKVKLTPEQDEVREQLEFKRKAILEAVGVPDDAAVIVEERLTSKDGLYSGQPDVIYLWKKDGKTFALIVDWKTGYIEVIESKGNLQLMGYAVLAAEEYGADEVFVAIAQPFFTHHPARYTKAALRAGDERIRGILARTEDRLAPAVPGEHQCRYCKARGGCKEAADMAMSVVNFTPELPASRVGELMKAVAVAKQIIPQIEDRARELLEADPDALPGWELGKDTTRETIKDLGGVIESVVREYPTTSRAEMLVHCSMSKTAFTKYVREETGLKGKALSAKVDELLAGFTESKPMKGRLKATKQPKSEAIA